MVDHRLVAMALAAVDSTNFERFAQAFYGAVQDREFIPLGGVHDGGAEGYNAEVVEDPDMFTDEGASSFIQVSKQVTTRAKIRSTVKRLREYGRNPKILTYITSQVIHDIDKEEKILSEELNCRIAIRDAKYIEAYVNSSQATQAAFTSYLQPCISHLFSPGVSSVGERTSKYSDRTLAVFLRQEVDSRIANTNLMESVADSLVLWALRDTESDPAHEKLLTRAEIRSRIETALPGAKALIRSSLDNRLMRLSAKDGPAGRQIWHYKKVDSFCLPFDTRAAVAVENADDDLLKLRVSDVFKDRLSTIDYKDTINLQDLIVSVCHSALERVFERQGLKLAQFVENSTEDDELYTDVAEISTAVVAELDVSPSTKEEIRRQALHVLRGTFYRSSAEERLYLGKLSRTYVLMLFLRNDTRIIEHFSSMASKLFLYVGSDVLIRALSEAFLAPESRTTVNLLKILKDAGATLVLTEKTVDEVATHIRKQIFEFENVYQRNEKHIALSLVEYIDRILIRSYFYARLSPVDGMNPPENWRSYVTQFCNYADVRANNGDHELASYLIGKFDLAYESADTMLNNIDKAELQQLANDIIDVKSKIGTVKEKDDILAHNDALQILRIYSKRLEHAEHSPGNPFGFQTWWLTQDQKVRRGAQRAVINHGGKFFMTRPEFLLSYIGFAPNLAAIRESYKTIFPSGLGVRLSYGIKTEQFDKVMRDASEISKVDTARAKAMVTAMTEKLKSDPSRQFDAAW